MDVCTASKMAPRGRRATTRSHRKERRDARSSLNRASTRRSRLRSIRPKLRPKKSCSGPSLQLSLTRWSDCFRHYGISRRTIQMNGRRTFPFPALSGAIRRTPEHQHLLNATAKGPAPVHSSPTSVSCMLGGPSSLAELDALTVITRHTLFTSMSIVFRFSCLSDV